MENLWERKCPVCRKRYKSVGRNIGLRRAASCDPTFSIVHVYGAREKTSEDMDNNQDIPYGPDQKPWKDTLSPLAIKEGQLIVSPPSQDPLQAYNFPDQEKGITPKFYQVPSTGLETKQFFQAQAETGVHSAVQTANFLGYQANLGNDYSYIAPYLKTSVNNIGDPFVPGSFTLNSKWMERNVLDYFASLWNAKWPHNPKIPETYWGYVLTMGSSEGNMYGLWNARDYLQGKFMMQDDEKQLCYYVQAKPPKEKPAAYTPVAFYSQDAHYSIVKTMVILEIKTFYEVGNDKYPGECPLDGTDGEWPTEVPSEHGDEWRGPGTVDIHKLCQLVDFFSAKGHPALIVFNYGSTFKGAYDNVEEAGTRLMLVLERNGMKERYIEVTNPETGRTEKKKRNGYWIHVDGALGASYMPFFHMAYHANRTLIKPAPLFDFRLPFVCSIVTSGHKFPGAPWPTGIYMTKTGLQLWPPSSPGYIGSPDTTFAGSRNGCSAIVLWTYISTYSYEKSVEKLLRCLALTEGLLEDMKKLEKDLKMDLWIDHSPLALTVRFKKPRDDIVYKYTLANETVSLPNGKQRTYTHVYVMGFTTKEKIDELLADLRTPDAFPKQWKQTSQIRFQSKQGGSATDFHHGLRVGSDDIGLLKGTKKLLVWPSSSRGFK